MDIDKVFDMDMDIETENELGNEEAGRLLQETMDGDDGEEARDLFD